jgi:hypothetical protein
LDFWDLIFKRYSSPFLFLDNLIIQGRFSDGIDTIYKQVDEEKMWQLYLSIPMKKQSYVEWKNEIISRNEEKPSFEVAEDIENIKNKSRNILKNFKPE